MDILKIIESKITDFTANYDVQRTTSSDTIYFEVEGCTVRVGNGRGSKLRNMVIDFDIDAYTVVRDVSLLVEFLECVVDAKEWGYNDLLESDNVIDAYNSLELVA